VRWVSVVGSPPVGVRPAARQRIPLPVTDLLAEDEEGIAFVAERRRSCVLRGRTRGAGDLVAERSTEGRVLLRRIASGLHRESRVEARSVMIGPVVVWLQRSCRHSRHSKGRARKRRGTLRRIGGLA
jgi:hypothetical protein